MLVRVMVFLGLAFFLTSCLGVGHSFFSRGVSSDIAVEQIHDPELEAVWWELSGGKLSPLANYGTASFMYEGITIRLRPRNDQPTVTFIGPLVPVVPVPPHAIGSITGISYELRSPFVVSLSLDASGVPLTFDTTKPTVTADHGIDVFATDAIRFSCNDPQQRYVTKQEKITSTDKMCIHLFFRMLPPHPSTSFSFYLDGLEKNGLPLKGPRIDFVRASSWQAGGNVSK